MREDCGPFLVPSDMRLPLLPLSLILTLVCLNRIESCLELCALTTREVFLRLGQKQTPESVNKYY